MGGAALETMRAAWPATDDGTDGAEWLAAVRGLRPIVEAGWETPLLMRMVAAGDDPADIAANWGGAYREAAVERFGIAQADLGKRFGATRDGVIANRRQEWLESNRAFDGAADAVRELLDAGPGLSVKIVTTKDRRFAKAILEHHGVFLKDDADLISVPSGDAKAAVVASLLEESERVVFVEDRIETLESVLEQDVPGSDRLALLFAEWGYSTDAMKERARANPKVVSVKTAAGLLVSGAKQ